MNWILVTIRAQIKIGYGYGYGAMVLELHLKQVIIVWLREWGIEDAKKETEVCTAYHFEIWIELNWIELNWSKANKQ